jgi:hypothetical protein
MLCLLGRGLRAVVGGLVGPWHDRSPAGPTGLESFDICIRRPEGGGMVSRAEEQRKVVARTWRNRLSGWGESIFGDLHDHGHHAIEPLIPTKVVVERRP